ncbi:zinc-dependent metalloprotease [Flavobacterium sp. N1994]|uniref:zinc-dependent metalloprotease n=1 Tax=Flavobacterium sp. N1994 TaxID=2986827 RepID=UPI002223E789|nr:zinc-dependent metalloprotease [Flavobacterium sp. N1994]
MKLKLLFALLVFQVSLAQHRTCGMQEQMQRIMNDPAQRQAYLDQQSKFETELQRINSNSNRSTNVVIRIPVAVHYPSAAAATAAVKTCLKNLAQKQIDILNADYNGTNADIANYANDAQYYPGTNTGSLQVQFVLATQNHPAGTGLVNGDVAVTFGTDFLSGADTDATWAGYCNFVVRNLSGGTLGYSPLGGSPSSGMTVVIDNNAFGATLTTTPTSCTGYVPGAPFNKGRTLTHELGHFFNLDHTFTACDGANCATSGDRVCDTPDQSTEDYNCPGAGSVQGCTSYALTMNYMDYVDDACMYMFTAGQATRMQAWYNAIATQLTTTALANEEYLQSYFSIYPNPNKGSFNIEFKDFSNSYSVEVFDITGKTIYENNFEQSSNLVQTINIQNATSGVYFINVKSDKGIVTKKLIIQ